MSKSDQNFNDETEQLALDAKKDLPPLNLIEESAEPISLQVQ